LRFAFQIDLKRPGWAAFLLRKERARWRLCKKEEAACWLPLPFVDVELGGLCGAGLAVAEAGFAAFGFQDLLGFACVGVGEGQWGLEGWQLFARDEQVDLGLVEGLALEKG
jgi:hypothetical protein